MTCRAKRPESFESQILGILKCHYCRWSIILILYGYSMLLPIWLCTRTVAYAPVKM